MYIRLQDLRDVSIMVNTDGRLREWLLSNIVCKSGYKTASLI